MEFRVDSLDSKRQQSRTLGPMEAVVAIGMEFRIEDHVGMINLAMPSITIKSMVQKFDQHGSVSQVEPSEQDQRLLLKLLHKATVAVEPQLTARLKVRDLLALDPGSIVLLDRDANQPIVAVANGKAKFEGQIVSYESGQLSFQIENLTAAE